MRKLGTNSILCVCMDPLGLCQTDETCLYKLCRTLRRPHNSKMIQTRSTIREASGFSHKQDRNPTPETLNPKPQACLDWRAGGRLAASSDCNLRGLFRFRIQGLGVWVLRGFLVVKLHVQRLGCWQSGRWDLSIGLRSLM